MRSMGTWEVRRSNIMPSFKFVKISYILTAIHVYPMNWIFKILVLAIWWLGVVWVWFHTFFALGHIVTRKKHYLNFIKISRRLTDIHIWYKVNWKLVIQGKWKLREVFTRFYQILTERDVIQWYSLRTLFK